MKITQAILDDLTAKAKESPRLRMNLDLRNSAEDQSQRMLNVGNIFVGLLTIGLLGLFFDFLFKAVQKIFFSWSEN